MKLYHFTSEAHLPLIREEGITRGDVPIGPAEGFVAPWLTREHRFSEQPWTHGSVYDKAAVRITVEIPDDHPNLYSWRQLVEIWDIPRWWVDALEAVGGPMAKHYVYLGGVPVEWIVEVTPRPVVKLNPA